VIVGIHCLEFMRGGGMHGRSCRRGLRVGQRENRASGDYRRQETTEGMPPSAGARWTALRPISR